MYKNIIVPLDGSPMSEAALPYAEALASRTGARITLVRAAYAHTLLGDRGLDQQAAVHGAQDYLNAVADDLEQRGFGVETDVPFSQAPVTWVGAEVDRRKADLIVMTTHDRVGVERWLHDDVADAVVTSARTPVLLVHASDEFPASKVFGRKQPLLLVPLDGSELAEAALPVASQLARVLNGRIALVGVVPGPDDGVEAIGRGVGSSSALERALLESDITEYLSTMVERLAAGGCRAQVSVRSGNPATEIAQAANELHAAVVIMATHGRTGLARSVLGSVASSVVHRSTRPVMLVRRPRPQTITQRVEQRFLSLAAA